MGNPEILKTALIRPIKLLLFERALLLLGCYQAMSYGYIVSRCCELIIHRPPPLSARS